MRFPSTGSNHVGSQGRSSAASGLAGCLWTIRNVVLHPTLLESTGWRYLVTSLQLSQQPGFEASWEPIIGVAGARRSCGVIESEAKCHI